MTKSWLIGAAAFAMMTGAALAQSSSSSTTTSTTGVPAVGSYGASKSQSIDSNGTQTDKTQTYSNGIGGTNSSSTTQTTTPYVAPYADTTTSHTTTTTIK